MDSSRDSIPFADVEELDRVADEFERLFLAGKSPQIEDYCEASHLSTALVLSELISLEYELLVKQGEPPTAASYITRFADHVPEVLRAIEAAKHRMSGSRASRELPKQIGRYIIRSQLGSGGFGEVFLAFDPKLQREVAIKVPVLNQRPSDAQVDAFVREARSAATLRHPALVSVHDVDLDGGRPFIVYEFIDGMHLGQWAEQRQLSIEDIVRLFVSIVDAIDHAHQAGVIHCDLKLANVLVDRGGQPHVADFGLALRNDVRPGAPELSGTPAMMAPEQILGRRERLDARTDIWALGGMLYELLSGRRPFEAETRSELFEKIQFTEPERLGGGTSALAIPDSLRAIVGRCLAKTPNDRFATARELGRDLRVVLEHWQHTTEGKQPAKKPSALAAVVPRGLRAFGREDAEFFLRLLPGPHDARGVPALVRFWKQRIEAETSEDCFRVGLLYGPSGSGKSSLMNAGVLPNLDRDRILVVRIEATATDTESQLRDAIRRYRTNGNAKPDRNESLLDSLSLTFDATSQKILIVIDQFEQWLQANPAGVEGDLIRLLKSCDGTRLQAILMVRDDFFSSVNLLFQALELPLREGQNYALVPRFSLPHAKNVLRLFGQAFGALPAEPSDEQEAFLQQAAAQLSEDNRVIGVRLALFADLMKDRPWVIDSLTQLGGVEGIGVTYLEDVFSGDRAGPMHRKYAEPCRGILRALLPELNSHIRGSAKSTDELRAVSKCSSDYDWKATINLLDHELRLITPTESDLVDGSPNGTYQLSHDYLVPSLREWLTRKQRETRRGRAQLALQELAGMWNQKSQARFLPGVMEWISMSLLTTRSRWTASERSLMTAASKLHLSRLTWAVAAIALLSWGIVALRRSDQADQTITKIASSNLENLPEIVDEVRQLRSWMEPRFRRAINTTDSPADDSNRLLKLRLTRLVVNEDATPEDDPLLRQLRSGLLSVAPKEIQSIAQVLLKKSDLSRIRTELWQWAREVQALTGVEQAENSRLLCVAGLLAHLDIDNANAWSTIAPQVCEHLVEQEGLLAARWVDTLKPAGPRLRQSLSQLLRKPPASLNNSRKELAEDALLQFASSDTLSLLESFVDLRPQAFTKVLPELGKADERAIRFVREILAEDLAPAWPEPELSPSMREAVPPEIRAAIERAAGIFTEEYAVCQTLAFSQISATIEALRPFGFRPIRVRPYLAEDSQLLVAAIWHRDGIDFEADFGLTQQQANAYDQEQKKAVAPVDVAGYLVADETEPSGFREAFCRVWAERVDYTGEVYSLYAGLGEAEQWKREVAISENQMRSAPAFQCYLGADGLRRYCGILAKSDIRSAVTFRNLTQREYAAHLDLDRVQTDINVVPVTEPRLAQEHYRRIAAELLEQDYRQDWLNSADYFPKLLEARFATGDWHAIETTQSESLEGPPEQAVYSVEKLAQWLSAIQPESRIAKYVAAAMHAERGDTGEAERLMRIHERLCWSESEARAAKAKIMCHVDMEDVPLRSLDFAIEAQPENAELLYHAASAYAECASVLASRDAARAETYQTKALEYFAAAVGNGFSDKVQFARDTAWDELRDEPAIQAQLNLLPTAPVYAGVWTTNSESQSTRLNGASPDEHLAEMKALADKGYRPYAISLGASDDLTLAASVWHRPLHSPLAAERLAQRRANAASAAFAMGDYERVWPLLGFSPDCSVRTRIIHQIEQTDANFEVLVDRLLTEADASRRFALLLSLGQFSPPSKMPTSDTTDASNEREQDHPLVRQIANWFEDDVDAGVHGACEWLLRKWDRADLIEAAHERLATGKQEGNRRWFRNKSNSHTFTVIEGPVEFIAGQSPQTVSLPDLRSESRTRTRIRRSFAIATKQVTAGQFRGLLDKIQVVKPINPAVSWDDRCAAGDTNWKLATLYCEFLNSQEKFPEVQWQYDGGFFDNEPVILPNDYLSRYGYRLPTAAEWEYACRAGTTTRRYFGEDSAYWGHYAWARENAGGKSWPVGSKKPNDLGLFDTLGNVREWMQERVGLRYRVKNIADDVEDLARFKEDEHRASYGMSFNDGISDLRASNVSGAFPFVSSSTVGIRIARTLP